jgi:Fe-S cluster assembly protein SufD
MTAASALLDRLVPSEAMQSDEPAWARHGRPEARAWLRDHGLPTGQDEAWRYTPLDDILASAFQPAPAGGCERVDGALVDQLAGIHGGARLVFVNGSFSRELSDVGVPSPGVRCTNLVSAHTEGAVPVTSSLGARHSWRPDGFVALNAVAGRDGAVVVVGRDVSVVEPIHVVHVSVPGAEPSAWHPRTLIEAGAGSRFTVIESYVGLPGVALINASSTVVVGRGARVVHHRMQAEAAGAVHVGHTAIAQDAGSEVRSSSTMLGAAIARSAIDVVLQGPDARIDLRGLYVVTGEQRHDNVITVEHAASGCSSTQLFKGVVNDRARGSFSGRIIVQPGTTATDAHQTSRSLVLSPTAQADSRPWLEILADDVKCTHGATIGRLGDEAMFYLRTRGIPEAEARTMLIGAFVGEVVEPPTLRSLLEATIAVKLGREPRT